MRPLVDRDKLGETPLHKAVRKGDLADVEALAEDSEALDAQNNLGLAPVHLAIHEGNVRAFELLMCAGAALSDGGPMLMPCIYMALHHGPEMLEACLRWGATLDTPKEGGLPLLHIACRSGELASVRLLLAAGARVTELDPSGGSAMHHAARSSPEMMREMASAGLSYSDTAANGSEPLHSASAADRPDCIRFLHREGRGVHAADDDGSVPLHYAASGGAEAAIQRLVELGADLEARNRYGRTPLMVASGNLRDGAVELLLRLGADPAARSFDGGDYHDFREWAEAQKRRIDEYAAALGEASSAAARQRFGDNVPPGTIVWPDGTIGPSRKHRFWHDGGSENKADS